MHYIMLQSLLEQNREACQSDQLKIEKQKMKSVMEELRESHLRDLKLWELKRNDLEERLQMASKTSSVGSNAISFRC